MKWLSVQFKIKTTSTCINKSCIWTLAKVSFNRSVHSPDLSRTGQDALPSH